MLDCFNALGGGEKARVLYRIVVLWQFSGELAGEEQKDS